MKIPGFSKLRKHEKNASKHESNRTITIYMGNINLNVFTQAYSITNIKDAKQTTCLSKDKTDQEFSRKLLNFRQLTWNGHWKILNMGSLIV